MDKNDSVFIVDDNGCELFRLAKTKNTIEDGIVPSRQESNLIQDSLSQFISGLPSLSKNIQGLQTYTAYFPADAAKNLKNGTAVIMKSKEGELLSNAIDSKSGKIIRQARLKSGITPANLALICWQLASMITAQKHLADIDRRLEAISKDVADIKRFQKQHFYAEIETEVEYIQSLVKSFCFEPTFIHEFERFHIHDFLRTYKSISKNIKILLNEIEVEIDKFQQNNFDRRKIKESVEYFNSERRNLTKLINLLIDLVKSQEILSHVYKIMMDDATFINEWERVNKKNKDICGNLIQRVNDLFFDKNNSLEETWPWYKCFGVGILVFGTPMYGIYEIYSTLDMLSKEPTKNRGLVSNDFQRRVQRWAQDLKDDIWGQESEMDKIKRINSQDINLEMMNLETNLLNTSLFNYQPNAQLIAFEVDRDGNVCNVRYVKDSSL